MLQTSPGYSRGYVRYVVRLDVVLDHQPEHKIDCGLRAEAAWILLDGDTGHFDIPRRSPFLKYAFDVVCACAIEHFEEPLVVLEGVGVSRVTSRSEQCRE